MFIGQAQLVALMIPDICNKEFCLRIPQEKSWEYKGLPKNYWFSDPELILYQFYISN